MESKVQVYNHPKFGDIRVVIIDEKIWFVAADVCRALELKNPSDILKRLDEDEKRRIPENRVVVDPILNIGSEKREVNIVNEPGFYHLVFSSRKEEAREFQRWVYHEVLPSLNHNGYYVMPAADKSLLSSKSKRREGQLKDARVYVLLMSDGTVKIGQTCRLQTRVTELKRKTGLTVKKIYFTLVISRENACLVEWACKEIFSSQRIDGEFFSVEFNAACKAVNSFVKIATVSLNSKRVVTIKKLIVDKKST